MFHLKLFSLILLLWITFDYTLGHGMVIDPVNRSSRWRYNNSAPTNWDDDGLNCGGFGAQWETNKGKCGLCGDDYSIPPPRPNELGGLYGEGVIVKTYLSGHTLPVTVRLTANHRGYFKFYLCELDKSKESDSCFAKHRLDLTNGTDRYIVPLDKRIGLFKMVLQLPKGLTCNHCVLQWIYNTGNSWGTCSDGHGAMGCGRQENYRTCSDIRIVEQKAVDLTADIDEAELLANVLSNEDMNLQEDKNDAAEIPM